MSLKLLTGRIEKVEARLAAKGAPFVVEGPTRAAPVAAAEIAAVEADLGVELPSSLRELYTRYAGSYRLRWSLAADAQSALVDGRDDRPTGGLHLLAPRELVAAATRADDGKTALVRFCDDGAGNGYALDYARGRAGAPRISAVARGAAAVPAAPTFDNFVATWAECAFADARGSALAALVAGFVKSGAWKGARSKAAVAEADALAASKVKWAAVEAARATALEAALASPRGVHHLDLERLGLEALPDAFGALVDLRDLFLTDNRLVALPPSFAKLAGLEKLQLSDNPVGTPATFALLAAPPKLSWLMMSKALPAHFLPPEVGRLRHLTFLSLPNNGLGEAPDALGDLTSLEELTLSDNALTRLPETCARLVALRYCFLHGNPALDLDTTFRLLARLPRLERVSFDARGEVPDSLRGLSHVRRFFVHAASDAAKRKIKRLLPAAETIQHRR
ncbi:MAG TPA: SMI1/KNR4 family protein [Minicystis sp.]|nr:SMI1/KNR4 family protein [Minicystis sp.]